MEREKVGKHTACDAFLALLLSHDNNNIESARNNIPLEELTLRFSKTDLFLHY